MNDATHKPGQHMAAESAVAMDVFLAAAARDVSGDVAAHDLERLKAIYTIARGSSDAAANILSYEAMRELGVPVTSLPPSIFSLGNGVRVQDAVALVISQSGASDDLVLSAKGITSQGAKVVAITNQPDSPVEQTSDVTIPIAAGPEHAVPATKTVVGAIGAGAALLAALAPNYAKRNAAALKSTFTTQLDDAEAAAIQASLLRARHVYVIGRDTGYGTAHEVALKLKECCAIHAEAYSSSEVLHGPLQLATNPLTILMLDTGADHIQDSLNQAEARFRDAGCDLHRIRSMPNDNALTPAMSAAVMLSLIYPVILNTALALGHDPDAPTTLSKVTQTT